MEEFLDNFYLSNSAGHLAKGNDSEGENEVDFDTIDIIAEEDSSDESDQNEMKVERRALAKNIRLESNSDITFVVIND